MSMRVTVRPRESSDGVAEPEVAEQTLQDLQRELDGLRRRLAQGPAIEQAKGLLMSRYAVDADTAFQMIRCWSMDENLKVGDICASLIEAASAGPEGTAATPRVTYAQARAHLTRSTRTSDTV